MAHQKKGPPDGVVLFFCCASRFAAGSCVACGSHSPRRDSRPKKPAPGRFFLTASSGSAPSKGGTTQTGSFFIWYTAQGIELHRLADAGLGCPEASAAGGGCSEPEGWAAAQSGGRALGARTAATRRNRERRRAPPVADAASRRAGQRRRVFPGTSKSSARRSARRGRLCSGPVAFPLVLQFLPRRLAPRSRAAVRQTR